MKPGLQYPLKRSTSMLGKSLSFVAVSLIAILSESKADSAYPWDSENGIYLVKVEGFHPDKPQEETFWGNELRSFTLELSIEEKFIGRVEEGMKVTVSGLQARMKHRLARRFEWSPDQNYSKWARLGYQSYEYHEYKKDDRFIVRSGLEEGINGVLRPTVLHKYNEVLFADIKAAKTNGKDLLESEFHECTGIRLDALVIKYNMSKNEDEQDALYKAIEKFLPLCRAQDLYRIANNISSEIFLQEAGKKKGTRKNYDRLDQRKKLLVLALQQCFERIPEKQLSDGMMSSIAQRHRSEVTRIRQSHLDAIPSLKTSPKKAEIESWFLGK